MIEITHDTTCHGSILAIAQSGNTLLVMDNTYHLMEVYPTSLSSIKTVTLASGSEPLHQFSKAMDANGTYHILYGIAGDGRVYHANVEEHLELLCDKVWHEGGLGCTRFDPTGRYYATGGQDGKVHVFDYASCDWVTSFDIRPDYISDLTFSSNGDYLLSAAYDKQVFIYDMVRIQAVGSFETSSVTEAACFFDDNKKVCCITRHKSFEVYDRREGRIVFNEPFFDAWPTVMITDERKRYAVVGTKQNLLYIISLDTLSVTAKIPLDVAGISTLTLTDEALFIGTVDGLVMRADRLHMQTEFEEALNKKAYKDASALLEKNALLYLSEATEQFEAQWPEVLVQAKEMLEQGRTDEAIALTTPFTKLNSKFSEEFFSYFSNSEEIIKLKALIDKGLFHAAYEIIEAFPTFRQLQLFKELEEHWFTAFKKARKQLAQGNYEGKLEAEKTLHPFSKVPEKEQSVIQLLASASVFENAEQLIRKKDFAAYFRMVEQYDFLTSTELYLKTMALGSTLHDKEVRLEQEGQWNDALELLKFLSLFPNHKKHAVARTREINDYLRFAELVKEQSIQAAYAQAEKSPYIQSSDLFQKLVARFNSDYEKAGDLASSGYPKKVLEALEPYFSIDFWNEKTKSIMKTAYINEIRRHDPDGFDTKATLEQYTALFGKDSFLVQAIGEMPGFPAELLNSVVAPETPKEQIAFGEYYETIIA
jgi:WD40 repeat protein